MTDSEIRLTLYVSGDSARSVEARRAVDALVEATAADSLEVEVVDVLLAPEVAERGNILTIPTLVREGVDPPRRIVGTLGAPRDLLDRLGLPSQGERSPDIDALAGMSAILQTFDWPTDAALRLDAYLDRIAAATGHARRRKPLRSYCIGLANPAGPKTTARLATIGDPEEESRRYQSMHHLVSQADWDDGAVVERALAHARAVVLEGHPPVWVIGDRAAPRSSKRTVGVARQQFGPRSAIGPCQLAVVITQAGPRRSLPIAHRLHLPDSWADSTSLRVQADVPRWVKKQPRWSLALNLVEQLLSSGYPRPERVRLDAIYAGHAGLLRGLAALDLDVDVAPPGETPKGLGCLDEMRKKVGLDDYTGRGWRGFHHHVTLCVATYAFMLAEDAARA